MDGVKSTEARELYIKKTSAMAAVEITKKGLEYIYQTLFE